MTVTSSRQREVKQTQNQGTTDIHEAEEMLDNPDEIVVIQRRGSRPQLNFSRRGMFRLAAKGMSNSDICDLLGIERNTLVKHFETELTMGRAHMRSGLKLQVIREAQRDKPQPAILIFAAKAFAGLTEAGVNDEGSSNQDQKVEVSINVMQKPAE